MAISSFYRRFTIQKPSVASYYSDRMLQLSGQPLSLHEIARIADWVPSGSVGIQISPAVVAQTLTLMLNRGVHPVIPSKGSVGASGDLAPLAHLALCVIGEGEAIYRGERMPGRTALERAGMRSPR